MMKQKMLVPAIAGLIGASSIFGLTNANAAEPISFDQIKAKALAEVNGTIVDFDFETKGTTSYYEVDILASNVKYELKYDATTGNLLKKEQERLKSKTASKYKAAAIQPALTMDEVEAKALQIVPNGTITSVGFEAKGSKSYYEVKVRTATATYELKFNAATGALLKQKSKQYNVKQTTVTTPETATIQTPLSVEAIKQKALAIVNGTITKVEYERKGTQGYYEVKIVTDTAKYELKLNAVTGELLKKEQESRD